MRRNEPYIEVVLGKGLTGRPAKPVVSAQPAVERAHLSSGAIRLTIAKSKDVFCWRVKLEGKPVERWRVSRPREKGPTIFHLDGLPPSKKMFLEVVAVSPGGLTSAPARLSIMSSPALALDLSLGKLEKPSGGNAPPEIGGVVRVWAVPPLVKISLQKPAPLYPDLKGHFRRVNSVWDGRTVRLFGARGEYTSFQLCIERLSNEPLALRILPRDFEGGKGIIPAGENIELFRNWCAKNKSEPWQPAYCIPLQHEGSVQIPDPTRKTFPTSRTRPSMWTSTFQKPLNPDFTQANLK